MATATQLTNTLYPQESRRRSYAKISNVLDVPNLIQVQLDSFNWFKTSGLEVLRKFDTVYFFNFLYLKGT